MKSDSVTKVTIIKMAALFLILAGIALLGIRIGPWLIENGKDPESIRSFLRGFGSAGFLAYMLIQAVHVMIVAIPGDVFNVCGGFVYGIPLGFLLSISGLMLGAVIVFYTSRLFGRDPFSRL